MQLSILAFMTVEATAVALDASISQLRLPMSMSCDLGYPHISPPLIRGYVVYFETLRSQFTT